MIALAALLLAAQPATPAPSGLLPSTPRDAAAGVTACRGLPDDREAAARRLIEAGWERATLPGAPAGTAPPPIFGRANVILVLAARSESPRLMGTGCMITARFERSVRWRHLLETGNQAFGQTARSPREGSAQWMLDGGRYLVMLSLRREGDPEASFFVVAMQGDAR